MSRDHTAGDAVEGGAVYRLTVRYDGRAYYGWQRHPGRPTLQGALEAAVEEYFGARCAVHASGRTDRGVHADAQVAHFTAPFAAEDEALVARLNETLGSDVEVLRCEPALPGFHAREDAVSKTYRYEIWNAPRCPDERAGRVWHVPGPLDVAAMERAAPVLVGTHDFSSFAKKVDHARRSSVRHLRAVDLVRDDHLIIMRFTADGFLYKMVRNLVRALVKVGEGRYDAAKLAEILAARDRRAAPGTAPASGLHLECVRYDADAPE